MTILGALLFTASVLSLILFHERHICDSLNICNDSKLNKLYMSSALVCGFFLTAIGIVIVVYVEKDLTAQVIVLKKKPKPRHPSPDSVACKEITEVSSRPRDRQENRQDSIDYNEYNQVPYYKRQSVIDRSLTKMPFFKKSKIVINVSDESDREEAKSKQEQQQWIKTRISADTLGFI